MLFNISAEKSPNLRTNLIICQGIFFLDPNRIRICISPYGYGSGSDFYYGSTNPDPDPHQCLKLCIGTR